MSISEDRFDLLENEESSQNMDVESGIQNYTSKETTTSGITWGLFIFMVIVFIFPALIIFIRCGIVPLFKTDILSSTIRNSSSILYPVERTTFMDQQLNRTLGSR